jgi:hypothetical protein
MNHGAVFVALNRERETGRGLAGHSVALDARDCWPRNCYISRGGEEEPGTCNQ